MQHVPNLKKTPLHPPTINVHGRKKEVLQRDVGTGFSYRFQKHDARDSKVYTYLWVLVVFQFGAQSCVRAVFTTLHISAFFFSEEVC